MYAQKLIDEAQGDENRLYDLFIQKLAERHTRPAIVEYSGVLKMPKEKYYLSEKMAQKILRLSNMKITRMKFIRSQVTIAATRKEIMTDSDLKGFKGAHGLLYDKN